MKDIFAAIMFIGLGYGAMYFVAVAGAWIWGL